MTVQFRKWRLLPACVFGHRKLEAYATYVQLRSVFLKRFSWLEIEEAKDLVGAQAG